MAVSLLASVVEAGSPLPYPGNVACLVFRFGFSYVAAGAQATRFPYMSPGPPGVPVLAVTPAPTPRDSEPGDLHCGFPNVILRRGEPVSGMVGSSWKGTGREGGEEAVFMAPTGTADRSLRGQLPPRAIRIPLTGLPSPTPAPPQLSDRTLARTQSLCATGPHFQGRLSPVFLLLVSNPDSEGNGRVGQREPLLPSTWQVGDLGPVLPERARVPVL